MNILLYATPLGLLIDIVGIYLLTRYGLSLDIRVGTAPPPENGKWGEGDFYFQVEGPDDGTEEREKRRRLKAQMGIYMVLVGFGLQLVGAVTELSV